MLFHMAKVMYDEGKVKWAIVSSKCAEEAFWVSVVLKGGILEVSPCGMSPYETL